MTMNLFGKGSLFHFKRQAEIISADSQAVYRHFDIGTAKPSLEERQLLAHHMIDICDPEEQFGVGQFMERADSLCSSIYQGNSIPVIVGGTGFYIRNFILGLPKTPESRPEVRAMVRQKLADLGNQALHNELELYDPVSAAKINVNDEYRICRALEVYYSTGILLSACKLPDEPRKEYSFCTIILDRPREELYSRIDLRVDQMFDMGLEKEVQALVNMGYGMDTPAMKAIGYSEFFAGGAFMSLGIDAIREKIKNDSHRYAKKQYTYMRGIPGAKIVPAEDIGAVSGIVSSFMEENT